MRAVLLTFLFLLINLSFAQVDSVQSDSALYSPSTVVKADTLKDTTTPKETLKPEKSIDSTAKEVKVESYKKASKDKFEKGSLKETASKMNKEKVAIQDLFSWSKIIWSLIIIVIAYFLIKLMVLILERLAERSTSHRLTFKSIAPVVKVVGWILVIFIVIQGIFRPPIETLIAVTASVGIAVGFAAQDILKNIFGGIMILFDRPFQVGDKIAVGEHYGEVKEIGLRSTRIVTKDDSLVSVPNAEVVNKAVSNSNSGETNCQVVAEIYLPIDIDTNEARQLATQAAQVSQYIYLNKPISVLFINEVKEKRSYLKMRLKAYVSDIRYEFAFQSEMTEIVMKSFLEQGLINKEELL